MPTPARAMHPNSLANLKPPWKSGEQPDRTGARVNPGQSYLQHLAELGRVTPDGEAHYDEDALRSIADDPKAPQEKRAAALDRLGMVNGGYFNAQPKMANHIDRVLDRFCGRPPQAVHVTSEEQTTIRVVLLDRTESPTHKMVQEIMGREALKADKPKQLEADEPKQLKAMADEQATKPEDQPAHPGARIGMDWRTASAGPVSDPT